MSEQPLICVKLETQPQQANACVIWLHGLGADGHDFAPIVPQLSLPPALAVRFIFPHAPIRPITINMQQSCRAWYDIYELTHLDKEDSPGIHASQQLIEQLIQEQIDAGIPPKRIILAGFSQGGAMALYTGLRYPQTLGGIIALSCYLPLAKQLSKEAHPSNQCTPIFQAHGTQDPLLPLALGEQTAQTLRQLHYSLEWHSYPMAHAVCPSEIEQLGSWMTQHLQP